jgi:hypothetical protein
VVAFASVAIVWTHRLYRPGYSQWQDTILDLKDEHALIEQPTDLFKILRYIEIGDGIADRRVVASSPA